MGKFLFKTVLFLLFSSLFVGFVYAANHVTYQAMPHRYIIRVTSQDTALPVSFTGSYITSSNSGTKMTRLDKVTPFEVEERANALDFMLMATSNTELFKVEILEKDQSGEHLRLTGTGLSDYGLISTDGIAIIGT